MLSSVLREKLALLLACCEYGAIPFCRLLTVGSFRHPASIRYSSHSNVQASHGRSMQPKHDALLVVLTGSRDSHQGLYADKGSAFRRTA